MTHNAMCHATVLVEVALSMGCKSAAISQDKPAEDNVSPYNAELLKEDVCWWRKLSVGSYC